jgi:hypothetical protein
MSSKTNCTLLERVVKRIQIKKIFSKQYIFKEKWNKLRNNQKL